MPSIEVLDFEKALEISVNDKRVLLGNGFGRAIFEGIFSYSALLDQADFSRLSPFARDAFNRLNTHSFEEVIKTLADSAEIGALYQIKDKEKLSALKDDAEKLKDVLVSAIAQNHPDLPNKISTAAYQRCRQFLSNFELFYSLNYDLLLYWAFMQNELKPGLIANDGFRTPEDGPNDYVSWDLNNHTQKIFYLHGALHLFDTDTELQKYTWINTRIPLIDQIRSAMDQYKYPLYVAEGSANQKISRIRHSDYLSRCLRSFDKIGGALFIFGFSFSDSDSHITKCIINNKVKQLFVSLHGEIGKPQNQTIISRAFEAQKHRIKERPLDVFFYNAETAHVWA
jgi:hypothetical protein